LTPNRRLGAYQDDDDRDGDPDCGNCGSSTIAYRDPETALDDVREEIELPSEPRCRNCLLRLI